ncbi:MAG: DNA polymerase I, partial [Bacteroidales bacterium]|nr:DNA polymerase I [Bacteroidales bacterium]
KPNLQNIPIRTERGMKIREAFVPGDPDGWIVSADYSQIELRLMAHLSGDAHMVAGFAHGADVHRATAARIFHLDPEQVSAEQRRHAKVANFGIIYGISAFGLSQRMGISRSEAKAFIEAYFQSYPGVKAYMDAVVAQAREKGYVETLFGRKRFLPDINSKNAVARGLAERNAINAPIQGSAADIIKLAMIAVSRRFAAEGLKSKMVLQVHDELVFDVTADERDRVMEIVKQEMESVCTLSVPLITECNYGKNWREAH